MRSVSIADHTTCGATGLFDLLSGVENHWPEWRGPNHDGVALTEVPTEWSDTANIAWRVPIAGRGYSSPVIWGDKLFLTSAIAAEQPAAPAADEQPGRRRGSSGGVGSGVEHKFVVLCLDRKTGKTLWERVATTSKPHEGYHGRYGSFASNSPVTDGKYLYAFFGSRGLYTYDLEGKLIWKKEFSPMRMRLGFGEGVAPVVDGDKLFLKFDQEEKSHLVTLDRRTGKELWRVDRDEVSSWSQPLVVVHEGKKQLIVSASAKIRSYEPETGKIIWEAGVLERNVIPAPVIQNGIVYLMSGHRIRSCLRFVSDGRAILPGPMPSCGAQTGDCPTPQLRCCRTKSYTSSRTAAC
ncbi:MAG: PQQ-binding-like beta-propeller repeat protein [Bryobacteraceae bacterium]